MIFPNSLKLKGFSDKSFSALPLGGVGGSALFSNIKLEKIVRSKGQAVTMFSIQTLFGLLFITMGERA